MKKFTKLYNLLNEGRIDVSYIYSSDGPNYNGDCIIELLDSNDVPIDFDSYWIEHLSTIEDYFSPKFAEDVFTKYKRCYSIRFSEIDPRNHHDEPTIIGVWEKGRNGVPVWYD